MSYIVAFVSYQGSEKRFPVECFRTDLVVGEDVVVRKSDGKLTIARICEVQYLNWDCKSRIECKLTEAKVTDGYRITLPSGSPLVRGVSTFEEFMAQLRTMGWLRLKPGRNTYRAVYAHMNQSDIGYILTRKNGIDIQIVPIKDNRPIQQGSVYGRSLGEGRVVRHALAHTTFNLFKGVLRFARSFMNNETDLDRYFVSQGSSDKRTPELREQSRRHRISFGSYDPYDNENVYPEDMPFGYHD